MNHTSRILPPYAVSSLSLIALAATLPGWSAQAQEVTITPTAAITEEWTDNAGGVGRNRLTGQGSEKESDFITTLNAGVGVTVEGARTNLNATYQFGYDHYLENDDQNGMRHNLAGVGTYEAIDDHLFLDARTTLTQRSLRAGPVSATPRTVADGNQTSIWTYALGPTWRQHLSDFADASLGYRLSGSTFFEADVGDAGETNRPSDSIGHEVTGTLLSGEQFGRLQWDVATLIGNYYNDGDLREERRTIDIGTEYRVSPEVGLLASTGYDSIDFHRTAGVRANDDPDADDVQAPFWTVGVRYNPSPNLDTRVEGGRRYDDAYYTGEINWAVTPRTTLAASYTIDVVTQQQDLIDRLDDTTGVFEEDLETGGDLTDDSFRRKTLSVRFSHVYERTTYGLTGSWAVREFSGSGGGDDSTLQFVASANRRLAPDTSGFLQIGYTLGDSGVRDGRNTIGTRQGNDSDSTSLRGSIGLSQQLTENLSGSLSYSHLRREEGDDDDTSTENSIVARVSANF